MVPFPLIMMFFCRVRSQGTNIQVRSNVLSSLSMQACWQMQSDSDVMRHGNLRQEPTHSDIPNQISLSLLLFLCRTCSFNLRPHGDLVMHFPNPSGASGIRPSGPRTGVTDACAMHKEWKYQRYPLVTGSSAKSKRSPRVEISSKFENYASRPKKKKADAASQRRPPHQLYTRVTP